MPESVSERHRAWERGWCSRSEEAAEGYGRWRRDRGGRSPQNDQARHRISGHTDGVRDRIVHHASGRSNNRSPAFCPNRSVQLIWQFASMWLLVPAR